jgi:hypothetical protein
VRSYYPFIDSDKKKEAITIYRSSISMNRQILSYAKQPKNWFLYNVGYPLPSKEFDYYPSQGLFYIFARFVSYLAIFLSSISPLYVIYMVLISQSKDKG